MKDECTKSRQAGISFLRIFATIGIVCLHTCSTLTENADLFTLSSSELKYFTAWHLVWRWAVPVFFMITGALLLSPNKPISYKSCITKYCKRILLAIAIFGIPMAALILIFDGVRGLPLVIGSIAAIFTGKSFAHLWYLYALVGIYLLLPVVKGFIDKAQERDCYSNRSPFCLNCFGTKF